MSIAVCTTPTLSRRQAGVANALHALAMELPQPSYAARCEALLSAHPELFPSLPSPRPRVIEVTRAERRSSAQRKRSRQLALPLRPTIAR